MANAMTALATTTLGSAASSVTFGSIPATYRDLRLVVTAQQNTTSDRQATIKPNNDAANASLVYMDGSGSSTASGTASNISIYYIAPGPAANSIVQSTTDIMDYSATDKHKTFLTRAGSSYNPVSAYTSRWASTSAITSLVIYPNIGGDFSAGSVFSLYGIVS